MDRFGRISAMEVLSGDPAAVWTSSASGETGVEESMWQLALAAGGSYPERPGEPDCIYYLRTGFCGYGSRCRFNHPPDRIVALETGKYTEGEYPERIDQPVCKFYVRTGTCKFGASCKYHHPRNGSGGGMSPILLNYFGYPMRPGEKECSYYLRTGECKFGVNCKFHHPQPEEIQAGAALMPAPAVPPPHQFNVLAGNWPVVRAPTISGSFMHVMPQGMVSVSGWNPYQAGGGTQIHGVTQLSPSAPAYTGPFAPLPSSSSSSSALHGSSQREAAAASAFPERPGQPECQYYMKTGECKFGSSCRYHHPPEWSPPKTDCMFSPHGLPLRPGSLPCTYYLQHGICKFGRTCKFDHPVGTLGCSPSVSSMVDMPVRSYIGILAPSDMRHDYFSGTVPDRVSSSSGSTSSGSLISKTRHLPVPVLSTTTAATAASASELRSSS